MSITPALCSFAHLKLARYLYKVWSWGRHNLEIERRKRDHIDAVLNENVTAKGATTGFERLYFEHVALPEMDLDDVETGCAIFGKRLAAPLLLSSMTGGTDIAKKINSHCRGNPGNGYRNGC